MEKLDQILKILKNKSIFVISALEIETNNSNQIIHSGVGKVNAALAVENIINLKKPKAIINYGTVGKINSSLTGLVECTQFIQHDIDASPLGFQRGETPFDKISQIKLSEEGYICATGDSFVTNKTNINADVVDMEAFALAKGCFLKNTIFKCYKYITDEADTAASEDWQANCNKGIKIFTEFLINKYGPM